MYFCKFDVLLIVINSKTRRRRRHETHEVSFNSYPTMIGEMVQNWQIQCSFTFNDFIFVHDDIHSHSTTSLYSHLTMYFFVTNIFIYIRNTYLRIHSFTFATHIHSHSRSEFSFNTVNSINILCAPSLRIIGSQAPACSIFWKTWPFFHLSQDVVSPEWFGEHQVHKALGSRRNANFRCKWSTKFF